MIIGRATISEMPKLQRSITEQIAVVQSCPVNQTLIIMDDDDSNAADDDVHNKPVAAAVVVVEGGGASGHGNGKPPILKSSRGRNQALPARFNDSVLHSWKKDKSEENARKKSSSFEDESSDVSLLPKRKKTKREVVPQIPQQPGFQLFSTVELIPESNNGNEGLLLGSNDDVDRNRRLCSTTLSSPSTSGGVGSSLPLGTKKAAPAPASASKQQQQQEGEKKNSFKLQDFRVGDLVWAICGKKFPAWPGIVVDNAPETVMKAFKPATILVMFYGHNRNGQRDYGWIKEGMIFPFQEYRERFQRQTKLYGSKPADFQLALGEAFLAASGPVQSGSGTGSQPDPLPTTNHSGIVEVTGSNVRELSLSDQIANIKRKESPCDSCGLTFPSRTLRKIKDTASESQSWCEQCLKQKKSKQHCGICKIVWQQSDGGHWVCCDGCDVWVHAECANTSCEPLKDLKKASYFCPDCRVKSSHKFSLLSKGQAEIRVEPNGESEVPENIIVVCNGVEGLYFRSLHLVQCMCQSCGTKKVTLPEWERHTGCRAKKWKSSVKLLESTLTLEKWLTDNNVDYNGPKLMDKKRLLGFLQEPYVPVIAKWTAERCAVCRWVDDWDYNKLVICNRCQVAVHQECYGVTNVQDFSSWVCRACETPEVEKQCCLCPMKGGALTPTDVDALWVHVTCAWFQPEVTFSDPIMEMASGILRVPANNFMKECVVCKQVHGSCIHCTKCSTAFHSMCALQAGYYMELNCSVKKGAQRSKWVTYCAGHSAPNPENVLVVRTPSVTFTATTSSSNDQSQERCLTGSRLASCKDPEPADGPVTEDDEVDPFSAARCRAFRRSRNKKVPEEPIFHRVMRPFHHPLEYIDSKSSHHELDRSKTFSSLKERLKHLQRTENLRVCFGKSGIHGWGLFARRKILEGEMVIEYLGEQVRKRISDLREKRYRAEGKDCYLFTFNDEVVIDSTNKGNIARIINHSCMPNCYARIFHISDEDSRLVLVAKVTVLAGTELTFDYKFSDDDKESSKVPCLCRAPNCRKFID